MFSLSRNVYTLRTPNILILKDNYALENMWLWQVSAKIYYESPPPGILHEHHKDLLKRILLKTLLRFLGRPFEAPLGGHLDKPLKASRETFEGQRTLRNYSNLESKS